jgi:exodeoxyribonuclease VII small subunit
MAKDTPVGELTYEQALGELETIVTALESGEHPLDEALALFERGQLLYQRCTELLDRAELKVKQLTEEGELKDFEA